MSKTWNICVGDNYRTRSLTKTTVDDPNYGHSYRSRHLKDTKQRQQSIIPVLRNRTEHKVGYVAFVWLRLHHRQLPDSRSAEQIKLKRAPGKYNLPLSVSCYLARLCVFQCFSYFLSFYHFFLIIMFSIYYSFSLSFFPWITVFLTLLFLLSWFYSSSKVLRFLSCIIPLCFLSIYLHCSPFYSLHLFSFSFVSFAVY